MRRAQNYSVSVEPYGKEHECDLFSCHHCQRQVPVMPGQHASDLGGFCRLCEQLICARCHDEGNCKPFEEKALEIERRYEANRMVSRLVGR